MFLFFFLITLHLEESVLSVPFVPYFSFYLFILERGREGEREGEKYQCVVASHVPLVGDLVHNRGLCPDWESNRRPLVHRLMLNSLSQASQGCICSLQRFSFWPDRWSIFVNYSWILKRKFILFLECQVLSMLLICNLELLCR